MELSSRIATAAMCCGCQWMAKRERESGTGDVDTPSLSNVPSRCRMWTDSCKDMPGPTCP
eukprot:2500331-Prorocentrum_lima.AAC.1